MSCVRWPLRGIYEFQYLFAQLTNSGCAKRQTACGTYDDKGFFRHAVNFCVYRGDECQRLNVPSGQDYELCSAHHAETELAELLRDRGLRSDGVAWLVGHYWACEPCATALKAIGVKEIRIREFAE